MLKERDLSIDILRCIGLFLIILAHVSPPGAIFQLRNFDVPLMVFVSGLSFSISSEGKKYQAYLLSRVKRLVVPVWVFVTVFYLFVFCLSPVLFGKYNNFDSYLNTLFFKDSLDASSNTLGYTWIIKIFLLMAIIAPLVKKITQNLSQWNIMAVAIILLCINQYLVLAIMNNADSNASLINNVAFTYLLPCLSYGVVFMLGVNYKKCTITFKLLSVILSLIAFLVFLWSYRAEFGGIVSTQSYKYPPSGYYLSYALMMIFILSLFVKSLAKKLNELLREVMVFVSSNSIWIYLWHIPVVEYFANTEVEYNFILKYLLACFLSMAIMYLQVWIISRLRSRMSPPVYKNLKDIFTG